MAGENLRRRLLEAAEEERARQTSQALVETFPGTSAGRALPASPLDQRPGSGTPAVNVLRVEGSGEMIALAGTGTAAGAGTGIVTLLDTIQAQVGITSVDAAGDGVTLRKAIWLAEVDVRWTDGYRGGGTVQITLGGTAIAESWSDIGPWGRFVDTMAFPVTAQSTFDVKVTPADGNSHDFEATVRVTLVEKFRTIASTAPSAPTVEAATSDGWQDTNPRNVTTPAGASAGDTLLMSVRVGNGRIDTPPSGWTELVEHTSSSGSEFRLYLFSKTAAGGAETATITGVKMADTGNYAVSAVVGAFAGLGALVSTASTSTAVWPSIAGAEAGQLLVGVTSYHQTTGLGSAHPSSNFTPSGPTSVESGSAGVDVPQMMASLALPSDGATSAYDNTDHGGTATIPICLAATFEAAGTGGG